MDDGTVVQQVVAFLAMDLVKGQADIFPHQSAGHVVQCTV